MSTEPVQDQFLQNDAAQADAGNAAEGASKKGKKGKEKKKKTVGQEIFSWVMVFVSAFAMAFIIRTFLFEPIRVDGSSMFSTLKDGEMMFVGKLGMAFNGVERGDVIVCKFPDHLERMMLESGGEPFDLNKVALNKSPGLFGIIMSTNYVKRLVGVPGDTIRLENGVLYVNGEAQAEEYLDDYAMEGDQYLFNGEPVADILAPFAAEHTYRDQFRFNQSYQRASFDEITLGENEYFVMGDNRGNSRDSRYYGTITRQMIVGIVKFVFWPFNGIRGIQ